VFSVEFGDGRAGDVSVQRYVLSPDTGAAIYLQLDAQLLEPLGGGPALHGKRVTVGLEPAARGVRDRHVCAIRLRESETR
jgi:hypothetical protein